MGHIELHNGTLIPLDMDPEEYAKIFIEDEGIGLGDCDTYLERLLDEYYNRFILIGKRLYIKKDINFGEDNISWHKVNPDGSIDYIVQFYNGGCCLDEAIKYEVEDKVYDN